MFVRTQSQSRKLRPSNAIAKQMAWAQIANFLELLLGRASWPLAYRATSGCQ